MKSIEVKCPKCKKMYLANEFNTKFRGPYLESECSKCGSLYSGKFLTFILRQEYDPDEDEVDRFNSCRRMIELARLMDKNLNPEPMKGQAKK